MVVSRGAGCAECVGFGARGARSRCVSLTQHQSRGNQAVSPINSSADVSIVKIWFQNRRTKWKKKDNVTNAEVAEIKQQNKPSGEEKKPEDVKEDPLALDMSKKNCNKILSEKLRSTKQLVQTVVPKPRRVEKGVVLESICDANDIESRISITKITNKLSSTELVGENKVSVKSFSPEEVKDLKFDTLSRDVEM
ncbi:hypothetical protein RR48_02941 [Papilio machaon]|uniref:Homeobox domain-containing protein n=1 Tax=Papilio machaon TaxID=76193 RepID=A0A0N1INX6_PAPMA|nr:hypothetical protein RR48_02941 [Papilio machaon]